MPDIAIRTAKLADMPALIRHRRRMFEDMGEGDVATLDAMCKGAEEYFAKALKDGSYRGWLAEEEGRIIGGGGIVISPWPASPLDAQPRRAMILNIYTEPEYRRRGIARRLMQVILDWLRQEEFSTVALHASNEGRALYESLGFQPTNEMRLKL
jgi:GNAT superfamily N-acetyltransferase